MWPVEPFPVTRMRQDEATIHGERIPCGFWLTFRPLSLFSADMAVRLHLLPPFISRGEGEEFVKAGHNLLLSVSPRDNSIGVFAGTVRKPRYA